MFLLLITSEAGLDSSEIFTLLSNCAISVAKIPAELIKLRIVVFFIMFQLYFIVSTFLVQTIH